MQEFKVKKKQPEPKEQNRPDGLSPDSVSEKKKREITPKEAAENADVNEVPDPVDP